MSGHRWTAWAYNRRQRRWLRHCTVGDGHCTAVETAAHRPKPGTA